VDEIKKVLWATMMKLQEYPNQDDQRIQEFNSTAFWLVEAATKGLGQTVANFAKEVTEVTK
jgi:hypothetical protein